MRYFFLVLLTVLTASCRRGPVPVNPQKVETALEGDRDLSRDVEQKRLQINADVALLAQKLVAQPVMTPRSGFSGYLAHFQVIRTTRQDSPFAVILDGEGYDAAETPPELQAFADLKGAHPYGGTYAFSGSDPKGGSKDRRDPLARLVLEIPGPTGDGLMAIGYADGEVSTVEAPSGALDDAKIQSILSTRGHP
jgi:hypothetical protein